MVIHQDHRLAPKASISRRTRLFIEFRKNREFAHTACLLSMGINHKKDVNIEMYSRGSSNKDSLVMEHRISVHPSMGSKDNSNTIKATKRLDNGSIETAMLRTTAIKVGERFAPIFVKRFPNLEVGLMKKPESGQAIRLGAINRDFTLFLGMFVSASNVIFECPLPKNVEIRQAVLGPYRFVFLYYFLSVPMHSTAYVAHCVSTAPEPFAGFTCEECIRWFEGNSSDLLEEFLAVVKSEEASENFKKIISRAEFFKTGDSDDPEWEKWWQGIVDAGLANWIE